LRGGGILGRIEKSIEIRAQPEKVWEMLALDRLPEWNEEYGDVKYTSDVRNPADKYRVGASSHTAIKGAGEICKGKRTALKKRKGGDFYLLPIAKTSG
jgi:hypothetical protein